MPNIYSAMYLQECEPKVFLAAQLFAYFVLRKNDQTLLALRQVSLLACFWCS